MNYEKNIKILTNFEKSLGNSQPVNFQIENPDGKMVKVSKEGFAKWMEERKNIKTPPKERLIYGAGGDIDSITYFIEIRSKGGIIKESYYLPRSEEEKKQIKKRQEINRKRREREAEEDKKDLKQKTQNQEKCQDEENSSIPGGKSQSAEKENNQQNQSQKSDNKDNSNKNIYYGVGLISLILVVTSAMIVWVKKKK